MYFRDWRVLQGKNCWYHKDGTARVFLTLDYDWPKIYQVATQSADIYFHNWVVPCDVEYFTSQFLANVPMAWQKFKTEFEMFSGTLDGTEIDPLMFEAGFTRTTDSTRNDSANASRNAEYSDRGSGTGKQLAHSDEMTNAQRSLNYVQGVQGAADINNGNIGELGNKYASNIADAVGNSQTDFGEQNVQSSTNQSGSSTQGDQSSGKSVFTEKVHETRINYYDNLAFLRERMDRLNKFQAFHKMFEPLFYMCESFSGRW